MGVDSYVGEFAGDGFAVTFDLGRYTGDYLKDGKKPGYFVTKKSIGGRSARVVNPLDQADASQASTSNWVAVMLSAYGLRT